jgi:hypothetical protein
MLFDLRSRGRRNVVKGVYTFLAILMGAGLVLFGIGGAVSGGLLNAFNGSSGSSGNKSPTAVQKNLERIVRQDPTNAQAWARLVTVRYNIATAANPNGSPTKASLAGVDSAWTHYMALKPAKPDTDLALQMEQVYGPTGLNQPADVVKAIEFKLAATKKPGVNDYEFYSVWASQAGQTRKSQLAQSQAESLAGAGKTSAARTKAVAAVKAAVAAGKAQLAQPSSGATAQTVTG